MLGEITDALESQNILNLLIFFLIYFFRKTHAELFDCNVMIIHERYKLQMDLLACSISSGMYPGSSC